MKRRCVFGRAAATFAREDVLTQQQQPLVLFADDHDDTREMYAGFFRANGFRTTEAANGLIAVELAKQLRPAFIVLDIRMPRLDGIAALKLIRRHEPLRTTPILVLTSFDFHEAEALGLGADATAVCTKPCTPDKLLSAIRTLLARRESNDA
jgi:CheY-like chemotaxis protein